jgi:threonyl-tRNA synthetase
MYQFQRPLLRSLYNARRILIFRNHERIATSIFTRPCSCTASLSSETISPTLNPTSKNPPKPPADHRELAKAQDIFTTSLYSPGSPLLLPNGADMFIKLSNLLRSLYPQFGFREVITPNIYKKSLWEKSGHWENYAEDMFEVKGRGASGKQEGVEIGEDEEFGLKPMNCPGHCLLFSSEKRSYRDLPIRFADFSALHRNEISGALSGLTRVRRFHQDDGHIFCRPSQIEEEIRKTMDFIQLIYGTIFNFGPYRLVLSTRPKENYIGTLEEWDSAESQLKNALDHSGRDWTLNEGDGAFYGPKIDIILKDSDGKEHQTATIQLDFQLPQRFGLSYTAPNPDSERKGIITPSQIDEKTESGPVAPVIIHRAILGSVERFLALMIEHYNGRYPFWISPRPATILSVSQTPAVLSYIEQVKQRITHYPQTSSDTKTSTKYDLPVTKFSNHIHVDTDISARSVGKKIREAKEKGYNFIIVVGPKDVEKGTVYLEMSNQHEALLAKKLLIHAKVVEQGDSARSISLNLDELEWFVRKLVVHYL